MSNIVSYRNWQYVECSNCGFEVIEHDAIEAGIDPTTGELLYLCQECDEEQEDDNE